MRYDVVVVGGGIVGLATAYHLSREYPELRLVVLEKESRLAIHQSARNSGVIHSGVYYRPGSLKAENCRKGRRALVDFCRREGVAHEICGKVIVAVEESELPRLRAIYERGLENGMQCEMIDRARLQEIEPYCGGIQAIFVPEAGIADFRGVALRLAELAAERGCEIRTSAAVAGFDRRHASTVVVTTSGDLETRVVVNCAGLYSDRVARMSGIDPGIQIVPFRGEFYELTSSARHLCRNLIYPVPDPAYPFLGVHFTRTYDGRVECGPSAIIAFAREGYRFTDIDLRESLEALRFRGFRKLLARHWRKGLTELMQSLSKRYYLKSLRRLIPLISLSDIEPVPSGVRAQAVRPDGSLVDDFLIEEQQGFINVCNAASPAATASLNIGRLIGEKAAGQFETV